MPEERRQVRNLGLSRGCGNKIHGIKTVSLSTSPFSQVSFRLAVGGILERLVEYSDMLLLC